MKAVVFHGIGDIRLDDVAEPTIEQATDAIVRITASAICGTDLHIVRGTMPGMKPGTILGHEGVGVVEELGTGRAQPQRRRPRGRPLDDRVRLLLVLPRAATTRSATTPTPTGKRAGTAFFGGPEDGGSVPRAAGRVRARPLRPRRAREAARRGQRRPGDPALRHLSHRRTSARSSPRSRPATRWRCSAAARSASSRSPARSSCGAGRIFAIDAIPSRLEMARAQGAEVDRLRRGGSGRGAQRAHRRHRRRSRDRRGRRRRESPAPGPRSGESRRPGGRPFDREVRRVAPESNPRTATGTRATRPRRRCAGRSRRWPRRARSRSSASTRPAPSRSRSARR